MKGYKHLSTIHAPADLRRLEMTQLCALCQELRHFLIHSVAKTGGHLASSLGTVELTVALHRVFDSPSDQIVWDVGHQAYAHKVLTGRGDRMDSLRQKDGLSGFAKTKESAHDAFIAGHSSTSVSVADGIAKAKCLLGEGGRAIAVIGDGAFTGGMAFEGLNNAARGGGNPIVILNDNHMSISKNVGSLTHYLARLRAAPSYFRFKDATKSVMGRLPAVGPLLVDAVEGGKYLLKNALYSASFFEDMGYVHMGPVDGHDLGMLIAVLQRAKSLARPVFIHVETRKGKGYLPAEENPGAYHSVPPFDPRTGVDPKPAADCFSAVFGKHLAALAKEDSRICAVTAAMKYGTGLNYFADEFASAGRFFDVGIAEQHAVAFSAALASKGLIPVLAVYSSFLQRGYDQLLHDCAIEPRHLVLGIDRAGLVGEDGETHQGIFDCAYLSTVPGAVIYAPADYAELGACLTRAVTREDALCAVRYPRGAQPVLPAAYGGDGDADFRLIPQRDGGRQLLIVSYGRIYGEVARAVELLRGAGRDAGVLKLTKIWPLNEQAVRQAARYEEILFVEEGIRHGGIGEHFLSALVAQGYRGGCVIHAVEGFVPQGTVSQQMAALGLDARGIADRVIGQCRERESS